MQPLVRGSLLASLFFLAQACQGSADMLAESEANEMALAGSYVVYDDQLQTPFTDWSWTMHNMAQTTTVHSGSDAIQMTPNPWGGLKLAASPALSISSYNALDFWINGGTQGGQTLRLSLSFSDGSSTQNTLVETLISGGIPANSWAHVTATFASLGVAAGKQLTAITFMSNSGTTQPDVFIDDITLLAANPPFAVFDDKLENSFTDGSWGTHNAADTSQAHSGTTSESFAPANWSGLQWTHASPFAAGSYQSVDLWINGGVTGNQNLWLGVTGTPKGTYRVSVNKYLNGSGIPANTWTHITVPFADMGASGVSIASIYLMDANGGAAQPTVYVDDINLIPANGTSGSGGGSTTGNTPSGTTTGSAPSGTTTGSQPNGTPGGGGSTGGGSTTGGSGTSTGAAAGWLYTQGNKIYTSDGKPFHGRGANIADPRGCGSCTGIDVNTSAAEVNRRIDMLVDQWGANFLRLDLESYNTSGAATDPTYLAAIQNIVNHIGTKPNVYVEVSMWVDPTLDSGGLPTPQSDASWRKIVDTFHSTPYVLFGIANEPQNNYDGSLDATVWGRMNDRATTIRAEEALYGNQKHIILAQGTGGWARFLSYYETHPLTAGDGTNFAYEVHVYDAASTFTSRFIQPSQTIPVVIGEFGPTSGFMTLQDCTTLQQQAKTAGVPYLGWTFHMRCPPNLLVDNSSGGCGVGMTLQPTSDWGVLLKNDLAQSW